MNEASVLDLLSEDGGERRASGEIASTLRQQRANYGGLG